MLFHLIKNRQCDFEGSTRCLPVQFRFRPAFDAGKECLELQRKRFALGLWQLGKRDLPVRSHMKLHGMLLSVIERDVFMGLEKP